VNSSSVYAKSTKGVIKHFKNTATVSGTIWRSHEVASFAILSLKRPILDIGCGDGIFAKRTFTGKMDFGLDISETELNKARKNNTYQNYILGDARSIPLPEKSIKTVFSNSVFEHIPNLIPVLSAINRVLEPGGILIFTTHSPLSKKFYGVKLFKKIGLRKVARAYENIFCQYLQLNTIWDIETWKKNLYASGFTTTEIRIIVSPKAAFWYEFFMPFTFLQNRIPLLKKVKITKLVLGLLGINFSGNHPKGRNFYIVAKKI